MVESKVLRIYENNIPLDTLINPMSDTLGYSTRIATFIASSFDDLILDEIKKLAIRDGITHFATINAKELARMIKVYDNSEYTKVVRCEKCEHWQELSVPEKGTYNKIGYCQKSGVIHPADYFCADGTLPLEWMEEMSNEV